MTTTTADDVVWCYRNFLSREPETREIVDATVAALPDVRELCKGFVESEEYKRRAGLSGGDPNTWLYHETKWGWLFPVCLEPNFITTHYPAYEERETDLIVSELRPGELALDLGARFGWFTCAMAHAVGPRGRVVAFDPDAATPSYITRATRINAWTHVDTICAGVGDRHGTARLMPDSTVSSGSGGTEIPIVRLDDFLVNRQKPVSVIKCDVEGSELAAFRGAIKILREDKPMILVEIAEEWAVRISGESFAAVYNLLADIGYSFVSVEDRSALDWPAIAARIDNEEIFNVAAYSKGRSG